MPLFTLADLRVKALGRVDDNTALYRNPEIDFVINEAIRIVAIATGFYRLTVQLPGYSQANKRVYAVPPDIIIPSELYFEGRRLRKLSLKRLARTRRTFLTDTTAGRGAVDFWAPIGNTWFTITPIDSIGGRDMTMVGIGEPPLLTDPNATMALENEYVDLISEYCTHRLPLKEGGKIFADGSISLNTFYDKLKERGKYERLKFPRYKLLNQPKVAAQ